MPRPTRPSARARHQDRRRRRPSSPARPIEALEARQLLSLAEWSGAGANGSAPVVIADFNRDGINDTARVGPDVASGVEVQLGWTDGPPTPPRTLLPGTSFDSVTSGDFDGDGRLDLAVVRSRREGVSDTGLVAILLGRGDGQFVLNSTDPDEREPVAVVAADLDGDGRLDLATADARDGDVSVRLGRGDGTFAPKQVWGNIPARAAQLAAGDISGDGKADIVASSALDGRLAVLINTGDGTFPAVVTRNLGEDRPGLLTLGDVDRDGRLDVVATDSSWGDSFPDVLSVYRNVGFNTFEPFGHYETAGPIRALAFGGYDGAGMPKVFRATADSQVSPTSLPTPHLRGLAVPNQTLVIDPQAGTRDKAVHLTIPEPSPGTAGAGRWASVDWGDGPQGFYAVSPGSGPTDYVTSWAGPNYPAGGSHPLRVVVQDLSWGVELARATGSLRVDRAIDLRGWDAPIAARETEPFTDRSLAQFGAPRADATADQFSVTIDWGDGTPAGPGSLRASTFPDSTDPSTGQTVPGFTLFEVLGSHRYDRVGTRTITVTVTDGVTGLTRSATATAQVSGWPLRLEPIEGPAAVVEDSPFTGRPLALIVQNGLHPGGDYSATIDWGDGGTSAATLVERPMAQIPEGPYTSAFVVQGGHDYAAPGTYTYTVRVTGRDGEAAQRSGTITVIASRVVDPPAPQPPPPRGNVPLTARLDPASDRGPSNTDGITNAAQPVFRGTATPGTEVELAGVRIDGNGPIVLGTATADAAGNWGLTSVMLADGRYSLAATTRDAQGRPLASVGLPGLVIDTLAPTVSAAALNARTNRAVLTFRDDRSGLDRASLGNPAIYHLVRRKPRGPGAVYQASSLTVGEAIPGGSQSVTLAFARRVRMRSASFLLGTSPGAITDMAGNKLDGVFSGRFPSGGSGAPGNSFVALFNVDGRGRASGPLSVTAARPRRRGR